MKHIFNFFRIVIILYLIVYAFARIVLFAEKKTSDAILPTIVNGMNILKVEGKSLAPEAPQNRFVIIKITTNYQVGDLIVYNNKTKNVIAKIVDRNNYIYIVKDENGNTLNLTDKDILAKVIKNNKNLSFLISALTNYVVLVLLLFVGTILPELLFDD